MPGVFAIRTFEAFNKTKKKGSKAFIDEVTKVYGPPMGSKRRNKNARRL